MRTYEKIQACKSTKSNFERQVFCVGLRTPLSTTYLFVESVRNGGDRHVITLQGLTFSSYKLAITL